MADASLIQGEGMLRGTGGVEAGVVGAFTDYTKQFKGADAAAIQRKALQQKKEREAKFAARTNAINGYMSQLKTNLDLTGYSTEQQRAMKNFLNSKRSEYAFAANELARIKDASDPEYQFYADAMNAINNQIVNLAEQSKAYNERKLQFADLNEKGLWSAGNDPQSADQAAYIYGLGEEKAMMGVDENGNITFDINGKTMLFNDYKEPFLKDYKAAQTILDLSNTVYSAGELTPANKELIRMQLEVALQAPEALQSIISNDFTLDGINLDNIVYNPEDIAGTRNQVINSLLSAFESTAAAGLRARGRRGGGRGSRGGRGGGGGGGSAADEAGVMPGKGVPDNKQGEYTIRVDAAIADAESGQLLEDETEDGYKVQYRIGIPFSIGSQKFTPYVHTVDKGDGQSTKVYAFKTTVDGNERVYNYDQLMELISSK